MELTFIDDRLIKVDEFIDGFHFNDCTQECNVHCDPDSSEYAGIYVLSNCVGFVNKVQTFQNYGQRA